VRGWHPRHTRAADPSCGWPAAPRPCAALCAAAYRSRPPGRCPATSSRSRRWFDAGGSTLAIRVRVDIVEDGDAAAANPVLGDAVVGPPRAVAEQLADYAAIGVTDISIIPGQDDTTSLRTVSALGELVLPELGWGRRNTMDTHR
jgi:alkanesulfonate monooxygenase SsuD/methylene tetrahydromethanopterin reductase-like flavin-dependent oxidoreductase (luciferase family)